MKILELKNVGYQYSKQSKNVFNDMNYSFEFAKVYGIVGPSGAGKTTLLSLLAGLTTPTKGDVLYNGKSTKKIDTYKYRAQNTGVVFQSYNLLPHLTAVENIILSLDASGKKYSTSKKRIANNVFQEVHLDNEYKNQKILHLSGGEQQRVAIARAISYSPDIILADEPTGNLDSATENNIMDLFKKFAHIDKKCVIIVTHNQKIAKSCDEILELKKYV
jgi:putative ABC transport system ATP-binding protein